MSYAVQKEKVLALLDRARGVVAAAQGEAEAERLTEAAGRVRDGRLTVAVVGEFKRGKSSLLNALVEEPGLFPVDVDIATSMVTTLEHAPEENVVVHLRTEDGGIAQRRIGRNEIPDYVTESGNPENAKGAALLNIAIPNKRLADGLVLVDTPGVGGLNTDHTLVTYEYVTTADVVLFALDAITPLTARELEFLQRVATRCDSIIFVVTKIDQRADYPVIVENTRQKIVDVLGERGRTAPIIPVSSAAKLSYLRGGDEEDLEDSNFAELDDALWGLLRRRGAALPLLRALGEATDALDGVAGPLQTELAVLEASSEEAVERVEAELREAQERLRELGSNNAEWREANRRGLQDLRKEIFRENDQRWDQLDQEVDALLDDEEATKDHRRLVSMVEAEMGSLRADMRRRLVDGAGRLHEQISRDTGLKLPELRMHDQALGQAGVGTGPNIEVGKLRVPKDTRLFEFMRNGLGGGTLGFGAGMVAASLVGVAFAPFALAAAGLGLGMRAATVRLKQSDARERRMEIGKPLARHVRSMRMASRDELDVALIELERALHDDYKRLIEEDVRRQKDKEAAIRRARSQPQAASDARIPQLRARLAELGRLSTEAGALAVAVEQVSDDADGGVAAATQQGSSIPADDGSWADAAGAALGAF